jgi:hypothetical protein
MIGTEEGNIPHRTKRPTVSGHVEPVVSSELIKAEYEGYRAYHTYTNLNNCPYTGELKEAWLLGQVKADKED